MMRKIKLSSVLVFVLLFGYTMKGFAQIPTVQYTPLAAHYYTHSTILDTARVYSNGLIDQLCSIYYSIFKNDTLTPVTNVADFGSIEYTVRSYSSNYLTQSITNGTGYLSVKPLFTSYNAFTLGIFDNYCVARNRPVMLEMVFDKPGYYKFYCEIQSCSNSGSSTGTSFTANGAPGCGNGSHTDYCASSCTNPTPLYGEALYLTICEQGSIAFSGGNTSYCPGEAVSLVYTLNNFNYQIDTAGLPLWLTPVIDTVANTLTLTGIAPPYNPLHPSYTFPVSAKISVNPIACPGSSINQTITIINAPSPVISGTNNICEGSSVELLSNLKGTWSSSNTTIAEITQSAPDSTVIITGLSDGNVNIFCETSTGECTVNSLPFAFTVNPVFKNTVSATICSNEYYNIGSSSYDIEGTYTNTLTSGSGCDSIIILNLAVNDTAFYEFWMTDTSYTWNTITYPVTGDYTQNFVASNGCDSVVTLHLTITAGIDNLDYEIRVFPNPAQDDIHIDFGKVPEAEIAINIFDTYGRKVYQSLMSKQENLIDVSSFTTGIYIMEVNTDKYLYHYQFRKF